LLGAISVLEAERYELEAALQAHQQIDQTQAQQLQHHAGVAGHQLSELAVEKMKERFQKVQLYIFLFNIFVLFD
jgi:hypothetical protein